MKFVTRLIIGTFTIVALTVLILVWGRSQGMSGIVVIALLVALLLAVLAGRSIARPLVALSDAAHDIAAGATPRFPRSGIPEIDTLVTALRRMHGDLVERAAQLQQEQAGALAIVDAMVEGVIASDARGRIVTANPAAHRLLGYPPTAGLPDLPTLFRVTNARDAVTRVLAGHEVNDCEVVLDDRTLLLNARPLHGNGAVLVLHDLTEVRRLEMVRRDFVANVSHELKTPLTSIAGYADTLSDSSIDPALRQRFLETIVANARRMHTLVDDLLDLARIESGRWAPRIEALDIAAAARDAWEPLREHARGADVHFAVSIGEGATHVDADSGAVRQIFTNLLDNAVRYVPRGGHIRCVTARTQGGIAVRIEDDGCGIGADHLPRLFERFYRVDPGRSREQGGTGLGLAIVRHLVEAHGGRVQAESELQRGTVMTCWFPSRG